MNMIMRRHLSYALFFGFLFSMCIGFGLGGVASAQSTPNNATTVCHLFGGDSFFDCQGSSGMTQCKKEADGIVNRLQCTGTTESQTCLGVETSVLITLNCVTQNTHRHVQDCSIINGDTIGCVPVSGGPSSGGVANPPDNSGSSGSSSNTGTPGTFRTGDEHATIHDTCGGGDGNKTVDLSIDIGCTGHGNALTDAAFAVVRFLSIGVGLVIIGSIVYRSIEYETADDPQASGNAIKGIKSSVKALFIFIFAAALLNFVIPAGFFK